MSAVGANDLLITLVMLISSGFGFPLGVPPEPQDELLLRVAPDECLYYTTWSGMASPDADSANQTEQLLAEPEIQQLLTTVERQVGAALQKMGGGRNQEANVMAAQGPHLLKTLLTHPTAIFLSEFKLGAEGPQVSGGMLVRVGDDVDQLKNTLERFQTDLLGDGVTEVDLVGEKFYRLQPAPQVPPIAWGTKGKYLIIGVGDGAVEGMFERVRTDPPEWLTNLQQQLPVERVSTVSYINLGYLTRNLAPQLGGPPVAQILQALGLDGVNEFGTVTGLDATGFVSRSWLGIEGEPRGILAPVSAPPLAAEDLAPIPHDALVSLAFRLDGAQVADIAFDVAREIDPDTADEMEEGLAEMEGALGLSLRDDVLKALGDVWTISTAPGDGGLITGWVATVSLRDSDRVSEIHGQLLEIVRREFGDSRRAPEIREMEFAGHKIYYLFVPDDDFPLTPSWTLTDDHLVVSLFPQTIKAYLSRAGQGESLATVPAVKKLLAADRGPVEVIYVDSQQVFRTVYPLIQVAAQFGLHELARQGISLDPILLPSGESVEKHLLPLVAAVTYREGGVELVTHQSLPGGSVGAAAPIAIALLVPAVDSARKAARRSEGMNNLKQIAIAAHNYHDTFRAFPAAHSADKDSKPLLSWRVHILPFIEERHLYEQFHLDEPWDSEHNRKLIAMMPSTYRAPGSKAEPGKTNYLGVAGEKMIFIKPKGDKDNQRFPQGAGFQHIRDGSSNTIMVVEASDEQAVVWTKPDDYVPDEETPLKGLVGVRAGGFLAALCDGSVRLIPASIDPQTLMNLFMKDDGNPIPGF